MVSVRQPSILLRVRSREPERLARPTAARRQASPDRREVVWGWTAASLSLLVRDDPANGVLVDGNPVYIPFPSEQAREQIPDAFTWRR